MTIVLDASAAYDLLTDRTCADQIEGIDEVIAPELIVSELLNACWKIVRSAGVAPSVERVMEFFERLRLLPILPYGRDAALLARRIDHPVYDCIYVAIADRERAKLLTRDERLSKKLRSASLGRLLR